MDDWVGEVMFQGSPETFERVKNLKVMEKLNCHEDGEQILNGYMEWIQKIPLNPLND